MSKEFVDHCYLDEPQNIEEKTPVETPDLSVFCDTCYDWVDEVTLISGQFHCSGCGNLVLKRKSKSEQRKYKIQIAKAIWGL